MKHRVLTVTLMTSAVIAAGAATSAAAPGAAPQKSADDVVAGFVAERDGISVAQAERKLDHKRAQEKSLEALTASGVATDGAYFVGDQLVVVVDEAAARAPVKAEGLAVRAGLGQKDLDKIVNKAARATKDAQGLVSLMPDLKSQSVIATVEPDAGADLRAALEGVEGVTVVNGPALTTHANVVPGRIMDMVPGTNCTLGFTGTTGSGNNVMLTAGHCVEGFPDILDGNGTHIGKGIRTRFATGRPSVDMGLMDIDAEDTGVPYVDTRGARGYIPVQGMSKNPIGSDICKAGNTTGWTCGQIQGYNLRVNYGSTVVTGLARASVCTQGGDSGGAYIGSNNLAQGMTSGGPIGARCGFNRGYAAGSYSFYQPVVDAANYYGVRIYTAR